MYVEKLNVIDEMKGQLAIVLDWQSRVDDVFSQCCTTTTTTTTTDAPDNNRNDLEILQQLWQVGQTHGSHSKGFVVLQQKN